MIYEYKCDQCGVVTEMLFRQVEDGTCKCQNCGCIANRMVSTGSFVLKGAGFYCNDSRDKKV